MSCMLCYEFQRKLEGTKVTIESFLAWKTKFDAETVKVKVVRDPSKPTGREMFLNNAALNESDIEFLTSGKTLKYTQVLQKYYNKNLSLLSTQITMTSIARETNFVLNDFFSAGESIQVDEALFDGLDDLDLDDEEEDDPDWNPDD